jgi:16S rRNA (guanine966-N2)-methyltransferase
LQRRLAADAWIHVEAPHTAAFDVPAEWRVHREGKTREVRYVLYRTGEQRE